MTKDEVARLVTSGTTTKPEHVTVLAISEDGKYALVKHPGGYDGRHFCRSWVKGWVSLHRLDGGRDIIGKYVWENADQGRLTKSRVNKLIADFHAGKL